MKRKPQAFAADLIVAAVESVTLRALHGDQVEASITTKRGEFVLRLIPLHNRALRVVDLRARDKKRTPRVTVPFLKGDED